MSRSGRFLPWMSRLGWSSVDVDCVEIEFLLESFADEIAASVACADRELSICEALVHLI